MAKIPTYFFLLLNMNAALAQIPVVLSGPVPTIPKHSLRAMEAESRGA